jgi:predicted transcriptional regulator
MQKKVKKMTTDEIMRHYKTQAAVAEALGISQAAVSQYQIQVVTRGELRADD